MKDKYVTEMNVMYVWVLMVVIALAGYLPLWGVYAVIFLGQHTIIKQRRWRQEVW